MGRILSETHLNGVQAVSLTRCVTFGQVAWVWKPSSSLSCVSEECNGNYIQDKALGSAQDIETLCNQAQQLLLFLLLLLLRVLNENLLLVKNSGHLESLGAQPVLP